MHIEMNESRNTGWLAACKILLVITFRSILILRITVATQWQSFQCTRCDKIGSDLCNQSAELTGCNVHRNPLSCGWQGGEKPGNKGIIKA